MNIEKHRAFLDSLDGEKGLPEEMHGLRFDASQNEVYNSRIEPWQMKAYLWERCRRAESRQIPNLKEKVKELMRDAMEVTRNRYKDCVGLGKTYADYEDFVELCESDKGQEVKP